MRRGILGGDEDDAAGLGVVLEQAKHSADSGATDMIMGTQIAPEDDEDEEKEGFD